MPQNRAHLSDDREREEMAVAVGCILIFSRRAFQRRLLDKELGATTSCFNSKKDGEEGGGEGRECPVRIAEILLVRPREWTELLRFPGSASSGTSSQLTLPTYLGAPPRRKPSGRHGRGHPARLQ